MSTLIRSMAAAHGIADHVATELDAIENCVGVNVVERAGSVFYKIVSRLHYGDEVCYLLASETSMERLSAYVAFTIANRP